MKADFARVRPGVLLLLLTTGAAPSQSCSGPGSTPDAGSEGGADAGVPGASAMGDAASNSEPPNASFEAGVSSAGDAAGEAAATSTDAAQDAAPGPAAYEAAVGPTDDAGVPVGPVWANWPMPNPPSTGLPNPQSYDTSVTGIVQDKVTGLTWQQTDTLAADGSTVKDAVAYCAGLTLGGYIDWRLPSRIELWSIDDTSRSSPAMDPSFTTVAENVPAGSVAAAPWTTSPGHGGYATPGQSTLLIDQFDQSVSSLTGMTITGGGSIRCVRGSTAQPSPHYTLQNGTVHDNGTQLTWQQGYSSAQMLPNGVTSYCAGLSLSGGGWRAPSVKELATLVDDALIAPAEDTSTFPLPPVPDGGPVDWSFYSATLVVGTTDSATRDVSFIDGVDGTGTNDLGFVYAPITVNFHWVRCVR